MLKTIGEIVREAESNYTQNTTQLSDFVNWSMNDTINKIDAYLNSKHTSGDTDSLGREKPFFNIVSAAVNIWYRATDIDRKNIKFVPTTISSRILALIANVILQNWMDENRFGQFLNSWGRSLSRYGSSVPKFIEKGETLTCSVIPWNRVICDPVDFDALPRIEKFYKTPAQLRQMKGYDASKVDALINAVTTRKTLRGFQKDIKNDFIELYEVHGELDSRLLDKEPDLSIENKDIKYRQQMHVISFVATDKKGEEYEDFCLYKGKENKDPYMITHLIEEDGRTLSIGAVEYLFDAQWMQNHTVKNMKDTLDIASKIIMQTADPRFVGRNILSSIESGDIFIHSLNMPLTRVANDKPDITALQNYGIMWRGLGQEITATPDAMRGITPVSGTPYSTTALLTGQSNSLFEIMTENKGLVLEDMMRTYIIPFIKKKLNHTDEIMGILDDAGIQEIDALYIPKEATKRFNKRAKDAILSGSIPMPFNPQAEQNAIQQELSSLGNKRSFKPDEFDKQTWAEILSDFEWDNIRVEITNENVDKQAIMQTLTTILQTIATNPAILQDPNARMVFNKILSETSVLSPIQFTAPPVSTLPQIPQQVGQEGGGLPIQ